MANCGVQGAITRLALAGQQFTFEQIDDQSVRNLVDDGEEAITGYYDPLSERVSLGLQVLTLNVRLRPTPKDITAILPLIGFDLATGTWTLPNAVSPASFTAIIDRSAKVHTYSTCYVNRATLAGQTGNKPLVIDLQIFCSTFSEGTSFGSPTALNNDGPYPFSTGVITLRDTARQFDRFALSINNNLQRQFENTLTAACIDVTKREITLATSVPYKSANTDLFTTPMITDALGDNATLVFTKGNQSTSIAFNNLKEIARPPGIPGKVAVRLPVFYRAYRDLTNKSVTITQDDTV